MPPKRSIAQQLKMKKLRESLVTTTARLDTRTTFELAPVAGYNKSRGKSMKAQIEAEEAAKAAKANAERLAQRADIKSAPASQQPAELKKMEEDRAVADKLVGMGNLSLKGLQFLTPEMKMLADRMDEAKVKELSRRLRARVALVSENLREKYAHVRREVDTNAVFDPDVNKKRVEAMHHVALQRGLRPGDLQHDILQEMLDEDNYRKSMKNQFGQLEGKLDKIFEGTSFERLTEGGQKHAEQAAEKKQLAQRFTKSFAKGWGRKAKERVALRSIGESSRSINSASSGDLRGTPLTPPQGSSRGVTPGMASGGSGGGAGVPAGTSGGGDGGASSAKTRGRTPAASKPASKLASKGGAASRGASSEGRKTAKGKPLIRKSQPVLHANTAAAKQDELVATQQWASREGIMSPASVKQVRTDRDGSASPQGKRSRPGSRAGTARSGGSAGTRPQSRGSAGSGSPSARLRRQPSSDSVRSSKDHEASAAEVLGNVSNLTKADFAYKGPAPDADIEAMMLKHGRAGAAPVAGDNSGAPPRAGAADPDGAASQAAGPISGLAAPGTPGGASAAGNGSVSASGFATPVTGGKRSVVSALSAPSGAGARGRTSGATFQQMLAQRDTRSVAQRKDELLPLAAFKRRRMRKASPRSQERDAARRLLKKVLDADPVTIPHGITRRQFFNRRHASAGLPLDDSVKRQALGARTTVSIHSDRPPRRVPMPGGWSRKAKLDMGESSRRRREADGTDTGLALNLGDTGVFTPIVSPDAQGAAGAAETKDPKAGRKKRILSAPSASQYNLLAGTGSQHGGGAGTVDHFPMPPAHLADPALKEDDPFDPDAVDPFAAPLPSSITGRKGSPRGRGRGALDVDDALMGRLEKLWAKLQAPAVQRFDFMCKYSNPSAASTMSDAVNVWEDAVDSVLARESVLTIFRAYQAQQAAAAAAEKAANEKAAAAALAAGEGDGGGDDGGAGDDVGVTSDRKAGGKGASGSGNGKGKDRASSAAKGATGDDIEQGSADGEGSADGDESGAAYDMWGPEEDDDIADEDYVRENLPTEQLAYLYKKHCFVEARATSEKTVTGQLSDIIRRVNKQCLVEAKNLRDKCGDALTFRGNDYAQVISRDAAGTPHYAAPAVALFAHVL